MTIFPNDTQHFVAAVANLTQNFKELLLITPSVEFPSMETICSEYSIR